MLAIINEKYGGTEVLELKEVPVPHPKPNEVLVKIHASSVNSWDWDILTGKPYLYRIIFGLKQPKINILGADIAGVVVETGDNVMGLSVGDEVMGDISATFGAFAEYVCVDESALIYKPKEIDFEIAATFPQAAVLAFQALNDIKPIKKEEEILINGAGGGVGTFAVQLAKLYQAEVTAVDSKEKLAMLSELGADHVIDYKAEDFAKGEKKYDRVIDVVANRSVKSYDRVLKDNGSLAVIGGKISSLLGTAILGLLKSKVGNKKFQIIIHQPNQNLEKILSLHKHNVLKPVIDKRFILSEVPQALQRIGEGKVQGKIVISIA